MRKSKLGKALSFVLVIVFIFTSYATTVMAATKSPYSEFYVIASDNENLLPHWLHIVVYNEQWYMSPQDACEYGGFKNYTISGNKVLFSRPYFIVGQLDPTDTRIGSDFYLYTDPFVVTYSGETITYNDSLYVNFNSVMNTLRTIASYDSSRGVFVFEPSTVFPEEIDGLCTCLMQNDRYNIATRGPLATRISYDVSTLWNTITGGETDEEAVFRAILSDPAYKDSKVAGYLKIVDNVQQKYDYVNSYIDLGKAYINDDIDTYTIIDTWVQNKIDESYLPYPRYKLEYRDMYEFYGSTISLEQFHEIYDDDSQSSGSNRIKVSRLAWKAYKDYQQVKSWNSAYMAGIKWAFSDDEIIETCPSRVVSTAHTVTEKYDARDYKLNTPILKDLIKKTAKEEIIKGAKEYLLGKWNVCILNKLDDLFGYSQTVSESNQIVISRRIQEQCYYKNSSLRNESDPFSVMGQKYLTILFLKAYMHSCSLLQNKSTLTKIASLLDGGWSDYDEKQDTYTDYYSSEIDRVAPILAFLIRIDDNRYISDYDNKIGDSGTTGVLKVDHGNYCVMFRFKLYDRNKNDLSKINDDLDVGSVFFLGEYEQDNNLNNGAEPIEWIVKSKGDSDVKASSARILDVHKFMSYDWYGSDLRRWCNHDFLETAFADYEIKRLEYMQFRGGRNDETQSASMDFSSVDRVLLYNTGAAVATPYANRSTNSENRYWLSKEYYNSAWDEYGHSYVKEDGTSGGGFYQDVYGTNNFEHTIFSRTYGIKPYIDVSFNSENDAKANLYSKAAPGDLITLGKDELDGITNNGYENIDWVVMARTDDYLFVQTYYPVNGIEDQNVSNWKNSTLREWLNSDFYNNHFDESEKRYIVKANLRSINGYATEDYLFPQSGFAKYLMYCNSGFVGSSSSRCSLETVKNPITVCAVLSLNGSAPEKMQVEGMYSSGFSNLGDKTLPYKVGDSVFFGSYEQDLDPTNGRESIEWIVLGFQGTKALVISKYALDYRSISSSDFGLSTDALRNWLNTTFRDNAFTDEDKQYINGDLLFMNYSMLKQYLPEGNPNRTALVTHYAYNMSLDNTGYSFYSDIKNGDTSFNKFLNPKEVYGNIGTLNGEYWAFGTGISGRVSPTGEWLEDKVSRKYYIRPAMWINLPDTVDVSTELQLIAALTDDTSRTYSVNIVEDFTISGDYSNLKITHGNVNFNGHTITIESKGDGGYFYFGSPESVVLHLEGGESGSVIRLDSSYSNFMLRDKDSTINNIKIYIGDVEQPDNTVNVANEQQFIAALSDDTTRAYTVNIVADFSISGDYSALKITHGSVNFNGHKLNIISKGNGGFFVFGGSDSVLIHLEGGEGSESAINLDSSYLGFMLSEKESTIKNIKIYVGNTELPSGMVNVANEQQLIVALTDSSTQDYTVNIVSDFTITGDFSNLKITHGSVNFNGHTIKINGNGDGGNFYFGASDSVLIHLEGGEGTGSVIRLNSSYKCFLLRNRKSSINNIKIYIGNNEQTTPTSEPTVDYAVFDCYPLEVVYEYKDCFTLTLKNKSDVQIADWAIKLTFNEKITNVQIYNGHAFDISQDGYSVIIRYKKEWYGTINPNDSREVACQINGYTPICPTKIELVETDPVVKKGYKLSVGDTRHGTVVLSKYLAKQGETITVNATPDEGYGVDFISVNGDVIDDTTFTMDECDTTVEVVFKKIKLETNEYAINLSKTTNGTASVSKETAFADEVLTVTVTPDPCFELDTIMVNGEVIEGDTFKMPSCEANVEVKFKAKPHTLTLMAGNPATCTEAGCEPYYECTSCGRKFSDKDGKNEISEPVAIPATGHNIVTHEAEEATCAKEGHGKYYECSVCHKLFSDEDGKSDLATPSIIPKLNHNLDLRKAKKPTCTDEGHEEYYECTRCHKLFSDEKGENEISKPVVIKKLGHDIEPIEEQAPTKESDGHIKYYKCKRCGKLFEDADGKNEITDENTVVIPKLKHNLTHVKAKAATCTEDGNKEYYECRDEDCQINSSGCGKKYSDPYGQHEIDDVVIHALGHDIKRVAAEAPTCTKDGHEEYYECTRCHEKYSDKDGKNKIDEVPVIPKLGHEWDEGEVTKEPTCEKKGTKTFKCIHDGCKKTKTEDIDPLGHDPKLVRGKRATRDNDGNKGHYVCSRCGKKFWDKACKRPADDKGIVIPAIGAAKLGEKATVKGLIYQVTNPSTNGSGTVSLLGIEGQIENITIPATVVIKETTYKVDMVVSEAFSGNKALKSVVIGENVVTIDSKAFYGCSSLTSVTGGDNVITIGTKAFAGCKKLKTFKITSPELAKIGSSAFSGDKKLKTIYIKNTTKLTKSGVKKSLKGSKVKTVKVKKSKVKAYKKIFKKKNSGRTVKVKK